MSRQLKTNNYSYAAGLIDGEGCVSIRKVPLRNKIGIYEYSLTVLINQTDGEAIDFVKGVFGGSVYKTNYDKAKLPVYRWELRGKHGAHFLKLIFPYLRIKKAQAELGMRFQISIDRGSNENGKRNKPLSQFERDFRHWCYEEMKRLKAIHHPCRAAVTTERESSSFDEMLQSELMGNEPLEVDMKRSTITKLGGSQQSQPAEVSRLEGGPT